MSESSNFGNRFLSSPMVSEDSFQLLPEYDLSDFPEPNFSR
jgi:hypothetical protein